MAGTFDIRFEQRSALNMRHVTHTLHVPCHSIPAFCSSTFFIRLHAGPSCCFSSIFFRGSSAFRFDLLLHDTRPAIAINIARLNFQTPLWADQRHASYLDFVVLHVDGGCVSWRRGLTCGRLRVEPWKLFTRLQLRFAIVFKIIAIQMRCLWFPLRISLGPAELTN